MHDCAQIQPVAQQGSDAGCPEFVEIPMLTFPILYAGWTFIAIETGIANYSLETPK
jgi:hypothetical protein